MGFAFDTIALGFLAAMLAYGVYAFRDRRAKAVCAALGVVLLAVLLWPGVRGQIFGRKAAEAAPSPAIFAQVAPRNAFRG